MELPCVFVALQTGESCPLFMETFSAFLMGSLPSRVPVQIARRHWAVSLEIRAPAESPAAGGTESQAFLFLPTAPPAVFCFPPPTHDFRLFSPSPLFNLT